RAAAATGAGRAQELANGRAKGLNKGDSNELVILWLMLAGGVLAIYWVPWAATRLNLDLYGWGSTPLVVIILTVLLVSQIARPTRQLLAALLIFAALVSLSSGVKRGHAERSYFGVYRVQDDGEFRTLVNGSTLHGAQRIRDEEGRDVDDWTPAT